MKYEIKSFIESPGTMPNRDHRPPEEQATDWLNQLTTQKSNVQFISMAVSTRDNGEPRITIIVSYD